MVHALVRFEETRDEPDFGNPSLKVISHTFKVLVIIHPIDIVMGKIYSDDTLQAKVDEERRGYRDMLLERGRIFEKTLRDNGVKSVPFTAGFFITVPADDPAGICAKLEEQDIFCLALAKGIRVSVASISKEKCVRCAEAMAALLK